MVSVWIYSHGAFAFLHAVLQGGGADTDAEIGRLVQRAATAGVRYTSKQIRAHLAIDMTES